MPYTTLQKIVILCSFLANGFTGGAQLKADFTTDKYAGCSPLQVTFTNTSTGADNDASYTWNLGNGNTSSIISPGAIYTQEGDYTVMLTVISGGKTSIQTKKITVYKKPVADFEAIEKRNCAPWNAEFKSTSTTTGSFTYVWDFGDGHTTSTNDNVASHTYNVEQKPTVSLTIVDVNGCSNTIVKREIVEVLPTIASGFSADKKVLCKTSDAVQFTNNCSGPGTLSYVWNFGDGHTSTEKEPSYVFNKKGIYTVSLTVSSSLGCTATSSLTDYLNVASYKTDFEVQETKCQNESLKFTNKSNPVPTTSIWDFGDGQQGEKLDVTHIYDIAGTKTVRLTNYYGECEESTEKNITIFALPDIQDFTVAEDMHCDKTIVTLADNTSDIEKWEWKRGDYGGYVFSNNRSPVIEMTVGFTINNERYAAELIQLKVTNKNGCNASFEKIIRVKLPSFDMNVTSADNGWPATCEKELEIKVSSWSNIEIEKYEWDFGDGFKIEGPNPPNHTFTKPGVYNIALKYTAKGGCVGTLTASAEVNEKPVIDFSVAGGGYDVCGNTPVAFDVKTNNAAIYSVFWDYGNGSCYSNLQTRDCYTRNPVYDTPGTYKVSFGAWNMGCSASVERTITVHLPIARIDGYKNSCEGDWGTVAFTHDCIGAEKITWDFGDGTTLSSLDKTVTHHYDTDGDYWVKLTAQNGDCSVTTAEWRVNVVHKRDLELTLDKSEACAEDEVKFIIKSESFGLYSQPLYVTGLEYGDNTPFMGRDIYCDKSVHYWFSCYYSSFEGGKQNIRAIVQNNAGCTTTSNFATINFKGAKADFDVQNNQPCFNENSTITFKDKSTINSGKIVSRTWDFGDGQTKTSTTGGDVSYTYKEPGTYHASLKITDDQGCTNNTNASSKTVQINGPKASFTVLPGTDVYLNTTVSFNNNSNTTGGTGNTQYKWNGLGSETYDPSVTPSFTYTTPGKYTVTLTATDPDTKCSSSYSAVINVKDFNSAFSFSRTFVSSSGCPPVLVKFTNTSANYTRVKWDFGDGITAYNVDAPSHVYEKPGKYYVKLMVTGNNGDIKTYTDSVMIKESSATINADVLDVCKNQNVKLNISAVNASSYVWDFGDGNLLSGSNTTQTHSYTTAGKYAAGIILNDENGCSVAVSLAQKINVHPDPDINIQLSKSLICKNESVVLNAISDAVSYIWTPNDGSLDNVASAAPLASPLVTTTYKVAVEDDIGCSNQKDVTVQVAQPITVKANRDTAICIGKPMQFSATGATTYKWINYAEGLSNTDIPNPTMIVRKSGMYTVKGFDSYGCFTSTADINVTALELPTVDAGKDVLVLSATPVQLNAQTSNDVVAWSWAPDKYLSCTKCPSPVSTPMSEIKYTVTVTSRAGCQASSEVIVKLECEAARVHIPNAFSPNNDGNNDVFKIKGIGVVNHLVIFDRWGTKVFERNNFVAADQSNCWDGTRNGLPLSTGAYVYLVEMQCENGKPFTQKGTVVLIR